MLLNEWAVLLPGSSKGTLPEQINFATKMPSILCRHGRYDDTLATRKSPSQSDEEAAKSGQKTMLRLVEDAKRKNVTLLASH